LVVGWNMVLQSLQACNRIEEYQANMVNCGKCEKYVRTMLALMVLGVLDKTNAFRPK